MFNINYHFEGSLLFFLSGIFAMPFDDNRGAFGLQLGGRDLGAGGRCSGCVSAAMRQRHGDQEKRSKFLKSATPWRPSWRAIHFTTPLIGDMAATRRCPKTMVRAALRQHASSNSLEIIHPSQDSAG